MPVEDSIGTEKKPGSLAVNALSLPGVLINTNTFSDKKVHKKLNKLGIKHVVTPLSPVSYTHLTLPTTPYV